MMTVLRLGSLRQMLFTFCIMVLGTGATIAQSPCDNVNLACNGAINVSINEDCYAAISVDLILESPPFADFPDDGTNYDITIIDESATPDTIVTYPSASNIVGQEYIDKQLKVSIQLVDCGISCWGYINVEDKIGPKIWDCNNGFLPDVTIECEDLNDPNIIDEPTIGGICADINPLTFEDDTLMMTCVGDIGQTILRTWYAADVQGNVTFCQQNINVRKIGLVDVVFPNDFLGTLDSGSDCDKYADLSPDGLLAIDPQYGYPTGVFCSNIMYFYTDIDYPQCGAQVKMLRDWFVIDWCTGESVSKGQIIKVTDIAPPVGVCPIDLDQDTLRVAVNPKTCLANPILNPMGIDGFDLLGHVALITDCSLPIDIEVGFLPAINGTDQPIEGPYQVIPKNNDGLYELPAIEDVAWVRYCFTDACGNSNKVDQTPNNPNDADNTCCYFEIATRDAQPPTAICEGFTKVPLVDGDMVEVPAEVFDDHSFDPCGGISHFEVKRESCACPAYNNECTSFGPSIHFCCADVGDTITVRLRVYDIDGNMSECLGLVCVEDQGTTTAICMPPTVNLDCTQDHTDRNLTGVPTGSSGDCSNGIRVGNDEFDFSGYDISCGIGTIRRSVRVFDVTSGNVVRTCTQNIIFLPEDNPTTLNPGDFTFPDDVTLDLCAPGFSTDPDISGKPTTTKTFGCINIAISKDDEGPFIDNSNGVCYKIRRTWKVVDWCRYDADYPDRHVLTGIQNIVVSNQSVPNLICPSSPMEFEAENGDCEAQVDISIDVTSSCNSAANVSWSLDIDSDGSVNQTGTGVDFSGVYKVGTHELTFTANNDCGGSNASCSVTFVITGDKGPLPICHGNVVLPLGNDGTVDVWASDFDLKSESGCTNEADLRFSFVSPNEANFPQTNAMYSCDDIPNGIAVSIPLVIYVVDASGQFSACASQLILQDSKDVCADMSNGAAIAGEIFTEDLVPVEDVMVELNNMDIGDVNMDMTSNQGNYAFSEVKYYNDYMIMPSKNTDYLNGVSTLDLVLIQKHILGLESLDSPYKLIAADADASGSITAIDLIELRKLILGVVDALPNADSWVFVPESHEFSDEYNPWNYKDNINTGDLYLSNMDADFYGVKVGDVNSTATANAYSAVIEKRSSEKVYLSADNYSFEQNEFVAIPVLIELETVLEGMQFTMDFDSESLTFLGIDSGELYVDQSNFALLNNYDGVLTFSISDNTAYELSENDMLFYIYFESKKSGTVGEVIEMSSRVTSAEAYNGDGEILDVEFLIRDVDNIQNKKLEVFQNEPNPFSAETEIAFYSPKDQVITLSVFDPNGKLILSRSNSFSKGINAFQVTNSDIQSYGVLLYRIDSASSSVTRKMIMVK